MSASFRVVPPHSHFPALIELSGEVRRVRVSEHAFYLIAEHAADRELGQFLDVEEAHILVSMPGEGIPLSTSQMKNSQFTEALVALAIIDMPRVGKGPFVLSPEFRAPRQAISTPCKPSSRGIRG